ncbi:MAG: rubrerythrin family protein [Ignavibacteria bacterium]
MKKMTKANLEAAFAGESQAYMKYSIYSEKADKEGFPEIARLFKAIAFAEKVHATNHLRALGGINDTKKNLAHAMEGENYEVTEMYPAFDAVAVLQEEKVAVKSIHFALEAEKIHEVMYNNARKSAEEGKDINATSIYVCSVCGHTQISSAPAECPACGLPGKKYHQF